MKALVIFVWMVGTTSLLGQSRASENYSLVQETVSSFGGGRESSSYELIEGDFDADISVSTNYSLRHGFVGQLTEDVQLVLVASENPVSEGGESILTAEIVHDDLTTTENVGAVWTAVIGGFSSLSPSGLVQADPVFQDTVQSFQGVVGGLSEEISVTIEDSDSDNFGGYAGDGLPDFWQVLHFGPSGSSHASPAEDPDGDGCNNLCEYLTGYDPNDRADFFSFEIQTVSGSVANFQISKVIPERTYRLERSIDIAQTEEWTEIDTFTVLTEELEYLILDDLASEDENFYRVVVTP